MKDWLSKIEKEYELDILFACEAGSRAWGLASDDSDHDIRFIYRYRSLKKYLSLKRAPAILDFKSPMDICGFDIFKTFELILKSNPSIYEWAYSPLVYKTNESFLWQLKKVIETSYSPKTLYKHYSSLKNRNVKELSRGEYSFKKQKQLLQAIRAELIREGIKNVSSICSPFEIIFNGRNINEKVYSAYCLLAAAKKNHCLLENKKVIEILQLLDCLNEDQEIENCLPRLRPSIDELEEWLWKTLDI